MNSTCARHAGIVVFLAALGSCAPSAWGQFAGVLTAHNDAARTGQNTQETILTPSNVNSTQFGKKCSFTVDGQIYAQPLYVPNVLISGKMHDVVYVATEHDSVYAFDADCLSAAPLWHVSFINPARGITTVPYSDTGSGDIQPEIGITGTPVIDAAGGTLYVSAKTKETSIRGARYVQRLHALDITSGKEKFKGPVIIGACVRGNGAGSSNGLLCFNALREGQRGGLLLLNGVVYIPWASHGDNDPYHGWILGYKAGTLARSAVYADSPNGTRAGIWQSGAGVAADTATGNIFVQTGNGTFDVNTGGVDLGDSLIKLATSGGLTVADYFTPFNQNFLNNFDIDLGSGGVLLLPQQTGAHPYESVSAGKEGKIFVVDRTNLGQFNPNTNNVVQTVLGSVGGYWSSPAYWNDAIYYSGVNDYLSMYTVAGGLLSNSPVSQAPTTFVFPGSTPSVSANGAANGIVWAIETQGAAVGGNAAVLHAYDATNVATELYNSNQAGTRDQPGPATKFSVPTIANGRVYIGTQTDLDVYGVL